MLYSFLKEECSLFGSKSVEELGYLLQDMNLLQRDYKPGEIVVSRGSRAEFLGIVFGGTVDVQKTAPAGEVVTITRLDKGQVFGEAVLFSRWQTYPADVVAAEETSIIFFHREQLLNLFSRDREVLLNFIENISNRMLLLSEKIELLSLGSLRKRIIRYLSGEAQRRKSSSFKLSLSRKELAEHLNIPRPSLSRELGKLRDEGYIEFEGDFFRILNPEALEDILWS